MERPCFSVEHERLGEGDNKNPSRQKSRSYIWRRVCPQTELEDPQTPQICCPAFNHASNRGANAGHVCSSSEKPATPFILLNEGQCNSVDLILLVLFSHTNNIQDGMTATFSRESFNPNDAFQAACAQNDVMAFMEKVRRRELAAEGARALVDEFCQFLNEERTWHLMEVVVPELRSPEIHMYVHVT